MTEKAPWWEGLTLKQQKFVQEYCGDANGNATLAARRAGYKGNESTVSSVGQENLKKPLIRDAVVAYRESVSTAAILSFEECATILSSIAAGAPMEPAPEGGMEPAKCKDRIGAIKALNDQMGRNAPTKTELSGTVGVVALTAEQAEALDVWLLVRDDPRVIEVIHERMGER